MSTSDKKLIIFIHTCAKYEETRAKLLERTWAKGHDNVIFITDNQHSTLKNHIYIGPYGTGATYHPGTVLKMFNLFLNNYSDYDYYMMIDDDSYLYIDKLLNFLSFFDKNEAYMIGDFLNWPKFHEYSNNGNYHLWVSGGPGIVFTKSCIIEYIILFGKFNRAYYNHDVWLHELFKVSDGSIRRVHCPGFHQNGAEDLYKKYANNDNNLVSIHFNGNMSLLSNYHINLEN
jgi:hypothetical protein